MLTLRLVAGRVVLPCLRCLVDDIPMGILMGIANRRASFSEDILL